MDEVDLNIIRELKKNVQTSFLKIAKQLGVSPKTVQTRYKKMKEKGIIYHATISIDLSKIGYQGKVYLMITNAPNQDANLTIEALNQMQDLIIVAKTIGDYDILAIGLIRNFKGFTKLVQGIKKVPSVGQIEFVLVTDTSFPVDKTYDRINLELPQP
jgi:DNA-binding Lrp family transcriptional regulator